MGTDGLLTSVPVFREDRDPGWEHVRMTGRKAGFWLGTCQNDVRGLSSRSVPILSSRSDPIRDLISSVSPSLLFSFRFFSLFPLFPRTGSRSGTQGFYYVNRYKKGRQKGSSSRPAGSY